MVSVVAEFDVKKDERNRVTLKSVPFDYYHAKVFDDGHIEMYPQVLVDASISAKTLAMMDTAMSKRNHREAGSVMDPRDIPGATAKRNK